MLGFADRHVSVKVFPCPEPSHPRIPIKLSVFSVEVAENPTSPETLWQLPSHDLLSPQCWSKAAAPTGLAPL